LTNNLITTRYRALWHTFFIYCDRVYLGTTQLWSSTASCRLLVALTTIVLPSTTNMTPASFWDYQYEPHSL